MSAPEPVLALRRYEAQIRRRLHRLEVDHAAPEVLAEAAELRWVPCDAPGFTRKGCGKGFAFYHCDGRLVRDKELRARLKTLVIPPAWKQVWICPDPSGHIQATGIDAAGRKQYLYHERWSFVRDAKKFSRLVPFGRSLPRLRRRIRRDLRRPLLDRRRVLASAARLLDSAHLRIGNRRYTQHNASYGLTTLQQSHVDLERDEMILSFVGKSGQEREARLNDPELLQVVQECLEIPGNTLFRYLDDDGSPRRIDSGDVNGYLADGFGGTFTAKDFRTWSGTALAVRHLLALQDREEEDEDLIRQTICEVSEALGNTPATCREYYVHPVVLDRFREDRLHSLGEAEAPRIRDLRVYEARTLVLLEGESA